MLHSSNPSGANPNHPHNPAQSPRGVGLAPALSSLSAFGTSGLAGAGTGAAGAQGANRKPFESQLVTRIQRPDGTFKELDPERAVQLYR